MLLLLVLFAGVQESGSSTSADYWSHECCILLNEGLGVPGESLNLENLFDLAALQIFSRSPCCIPDLFENPFSLVGGLTVSILKCAFLK